MNYEGSCIGVYSSRSYTNILKVIRQLQAVDYSDSQLSVIGRRTHLTEEKFRILSLFKTFRHKIAEKYFWDKLRDLIKGDVFFKTTKFDSIAVTGGLSRITLDKNQTENKDDPYAEINRLLYCVGIPKVSFEFYETLLRNGRFLLIIHGNTQELKRAGNLLDLSGNINVSLHLANTS